MDKIFLSLELNLYGNDAAPLRLEHEHNRLCGFLNKIFGEKNKQHDGESPYTIAILKRKFNRRDGVVFEDNSAKIRITSIYYEIIESLLRGLDRQRNIPHKDRASLSGMYVTSANLEEIPKLTPFNGDEYLLSLLSPILLQDSKRRGTNKPLYITHKHDDFGDYLQSQTKRKLESLGFDSDIQINLDGTFQGRSLRVDKRKINNHIVYCSNNGLLRIRAKDPESIRALMAVGVGNSTGMGFGAISFRNPNI